MNTIRQLHALLKKLLVLLKDLIGIPIQSLRRSDGHPTWYVRWSRVIATLLLGFLASVAVDYWLLGTYRRESLESYVARLERLNRKVAVTYKRAERDGVRILVRRHSASEWGMEIEAPLEMDELALPTIRLVFDQKLEDETYETPSWPTIYMEPPAFMRGHAPVWREGTTPLGPSSDASGDTSASMRSIRPDGVMVWSPVAAAGVQPSLAAIPIPRSDWDREVIQEGEQELKRGRTFTAGERAAIQWLWKSATTEEPVANVDNMVSRLRGEHFLRAFVSPSGRMQLTDDRSILHQRERCFLFGLLRRDDESTTIELEFEDQSRPILVVYRQAPLDKLGKEEATPRMRGMLRLIRSDATLQTHYKNVDSYDGHFYAFPELWAARLALENNLHGALMKQAPGLLGSLTAPGSPALERRTFKKASGAPSYYDSYSLCYALLCAVELCRLCVAAEDYGGEPDRYKEVRKTLETDMQQIALLLAGNIRDGKALRHNPDAHHHGEDNSVGLTYLYSLWKLLDYEAVALAPLDGARPSATDQPIRALFSSATDLGRSASIKARLHEYAKNIAGQLESRYVRYSGDSSRRALWPGALLAKLYLAIEVQEGDQDVAWIEFQKAWPTGISPSSGTLVAQSFAWKDYGLNYLARCPELVCRRSNLNELQPTLRVDQAGEPGYALARLIVDLLNDDELERAITEGHRSGYNQNFVCMRHLSLIEALAEAPALDLTK